MSFFLLRAPLLPARSIREAAGPGRDLSASLAAMFEDRRFARALCIASPSLYATCEKAISGQAQTGQQLERAYAAVRRYLTRTSTRPTPFGLCAGVALGHWGDDSSLQLDMERSRSHTLVAMERVAHMASSLEADRDVMRRSRLVTNQLVTTVGRRALLPPPPDFRANGAPQARSVRLTAPVARALELARRPVGWQCLVDRLRSEWTSVEAEIIESMVADLTTNGFLLTDIHPPLTVVDPARWLLQRLADVPAAMESRQRLARQIQAADELNEQPLGASTGLAVTRQMAEEGAEPHYRTDLRLGLVGDRLNTQVGMEAVRAAEWLLRLSRLPQGASWLASYRELFLERYGTDRRVPVLELLDPAAGLGPPDFDTPPASQTPMLAALRRQDRLLLTHATRALWQRQHEIELSEGDLEALCVTSRRALVPPDSLEIYVSIAARSLEALDRGDFRLVVNAFGGSRGAGKTFGRFAGLFAEAGTQALAEAAAAKASLDPEALWAEVLHFPAHARSMNVCARPAARGALLLAGAFPPNEEDRGLSISMVAVGADDGCLRLYTMDDGRVVRPTVTHMLNLAHAPQVVRFVYELESAGTPLFHAFPWGPASSFPFLPRVTHKRCVLRCARWRLGADTLGASAPKSAMERSSWLLRWLEEWSVPPCVYLTSGDQRLLLDLSAPEDLKELVRELGRLIEGRRSEILLEEVVPSLDELWCADRSGERHVAEIVVPLVSTGVVAQAWPRRSPGPAGTAFGGERCKPLGSEWLYFQLPLRQELEEAVLADAIHELAEQALGSRVAELWHFVRYTQPRRHLRVRFRTRREDSAGAAVDWLSRKMRELLGTDLQSQVSLAVYEREVERYGGGQAIELVEEIFSADSSFAARVIRREPMPEERAAIASLAVRQLLAACGLELQARLEWYRANAGGGRIGRLPYRECRRILAGDSAAAGDDGLRAILARRGEDLRSPAACLRELECSGGLSKPLDSILSSLVHMSCNRLFGPDSKREQEVRGMALRLEESLLHAPLVMTPS